MDEFTKVIVYGGALPFVIALVIVTPLSFIRRREDEKRDRFAWRMPLALGLAIVIAMQVLHGWPWHNVLYAACAGAAGGLLMSFTSRQVWVRGLLLVVTAAAVNWVMWGSVVIEADRWRWFVPGVGTLLLLGTLEPLAVRRPGPTLPVAIALGAGAAILFAGSLNFGSVLLAVAAGLGGCAISGFTRRPFSIADGTLAVAVPMLVVVPLVGFLDADFTDNALHPVAYLVPSLAPLSLWLFEIPALARRSAWVRVPLSWLLVAILCGAAAWIAYAPEDDSGESEDDLLQQMYGDF